MQKGAIIDRPFFAAVRLNLEEMPLAVPVDPSARAIVNRPGSSGIADTIEASNASPDGQTLLITYKYLSNMVNVQGFFNQSHRQF